MEVRRQKLVRQDRHKGLWMETYQGHRLNRCGEWGVLKLLTQALKLLKHVNCKGAVPW
jgi:hypothetical protein